MNVLDRFIGYSASYGLAFEDIRVDVEIIKRVPSWEAVPLRSRPEEEAQESEDAEGGDDKQKESAVPHAMLRGHSRTMDMSYESSRKKQKGYPVFVEAYGGRMSSLMLSYTALVTKDSGTLQANAPLLDELTLKWYYAYLCSHKFVQTHAQIPRNLHDPIYLRSRSRRFPYVSIARSAYFSCHIGSPSACRGFVASCLYWVLFHL